MKIESAELIGSTGLSFETPYRASTGYVLARHLLAWAMRPAGLGAVVRFAGVCVARSMRCATQPTGRQPPSPGAHCSLWKGFLESMWYFQI